MSEEAPPETTPIECPICGGPLTTPFVSSAPKDSLVDCGNCGKHWLSSLGHRLLARQSTQARARLAHALVKVPTEVPLKREFIEQLIKMTPLPGALERLDNLVLYMAETFAPGEQRALGLTTLCATLGVANVREARWVLDEALRLGLVGAPNAPSDVPAVIAAIRPFRVALTIDGWKRHAELMRNGARSTHAFMAMKFGDAEMDRAFAEFMQPAVAQTGFELRTTVGDHQTAGSIDNRMRVEIRTSRFVLCDLTHGNQGAYWEAGFAEGLGRPVIYTCRRDVLETPKAVHFDTDHQLIIKWDLANMDEAMQELKATIRATLPAEAKLQDA